MTVCVVLPKKQTIGVAATDNHPHAEVIHTLAGKILPRRYRVLSLISAGKFCATYRAVYEPVDQMVLMTVYRSAHSDEGYFFRRFHAESKKLAMLEHKNVLGYMDFGVVEPGLPYVIQQYARGQKLSQLLQAETRLPMDRARRILSQVSAALDHAQYHNCMHGTLTPDEILIVDDNEEEDGQVVKVSHFGILSLWHKLSKQKPTPFDHLEFIGNASYMSPEQCRGENVDARSDLYSIGCILHEAVTGRPPFVHEDPSEVMGMHLDQPPPTLAKGRQDLPKPLLSVINHCLNKDASMRYQVAHELEKDLVQGTCPDAEQGELCAPVAKASRIVEENSGIPVQQVIILGGIVGGVLTTGVAILLFTQVGGLFANEGAWKSNIEKTQSCLDTGKFDEALNAANVSIKESEKFKAPDARHVDSMINLAEVHLACGKNTDAEELARRALSEAKSLPQADGSQAKGLVIMAHSKLHLGKIEDSEEFARQAHELASKQTPSNQALLTGLALADVLVAKRKLDEADSLIAQIKPLAEKSSVKESTQLLQTEAAVKAAQGDLETAKNKLGTALFHRQKKLGLENPLVADVLMSMSKLYLQEKEYDKATSSLENALELRQKAFGADSPKCAEIVMQLAETLEAAGKLDEAEKQYRLAVEINEKAFGALTPEMIPSIEKIGAFFRRRGDAHAAEVFEGEIKEIHQNFRTAHNI